MVSRKAALSSACLLLLAAILTAQSVTIDLQAPAVVGQSPFGSGPVTVRVARNGAGDPSYICYARASVVASKLAVTGATNATPIVVTTAPHGLEDQAIVTISGVVGNTAANGTFQVDVLSATTMALKTLADYATNVAGNGAYTSGGTLETTSPRLNQAVWIVRTFEYDGSNRLIAAKWVNGGNGKAACTDATAVAAYPRQ